LKKARIDLETKEGIDLGEKFLSYCEEKHPQYIPLARGIILHQKADELFHDGYLKEKIKSTAKKVAPIDRPFFKRNAHGIIELGSVFIEKDEMPLKIKKALEYRINDLNCYLTFLGKSIKDKIKVSTVLELAKFFYRFKLLPREKYNGPHNSDIMLRYR